MSRRSRFQATLQTLRNASSESIPCTLHALPMHVRQHQCPSQSLQRLFVVFVNFLSTHLTRQTAPYPCIARDGPLRDRCLSRDAHPPPRPTLSRAHH